MKWLFKIQSKYYPGFLKSILKFCIFLGFDYKTSKTIATFTVPFILLSLFVWVLYELEKKFCWILKYKLKDTMFRFGGFIEMKTGTKTVTGGSGDTKAVPYPYEVKNFPKFYFKKGYFYFKPQARSTWQSSQLEELQHQFELVTSIKIQYERMEGGFYVFKIIKEVPEAVGVN